MKKMPLEEGKYLYVQFYFDLRPFQSWLWKIHSRILGKTSSKWRTQRCYRFPAICSTNKAQTSSNPSQTTLKENGKLKNFHPTTTFTQNCSFSVNSTLYCQRYWIIRTLLRAKSTRMQADRVEKTFGQVLCTERVETESESENELDIRFWPVSVVVYLKSIPLRRLAFRISSFFERASCMNFCFIMSSQSNALCI